MDSSNYSKPRIVQLEGDHSSTRWTLRGRSQTSIILGKLTGPQILSTHNLRLTSFTYLPKANILPISSTGLSPLKWDAPSLPMLSALNITRLQVSRLSQVGARAFAHLLFLIEDDPTLDSASVDISWLDDALCALIGKTCRKARRLQIGSEGTRLGDKGIINILDACEHLEEFSLVDAQGLPNFDFADCGYYSPVPQVGYQSHYGARSKNSRHSSESCASRYRRARFSTHGPSTTSLVYTLSL